MDQPIRWTLPAPAFVAFDAPLSVATVDGGLDPAYRTFLRAEVGFDADRHADAGALAAAAGRLASKEWHPTWGHRYDRPRDPVEFRDLTRVLRALASAGARLGGPGATVETYQDDDALRERARETAVDCPACSVREFDTGASTDSATASTDDGGATATVVECCETHHRELHREYVESRSEPDRPTPEEAFDLANRLEAEALAIDAAESIADVAAYDPHAVRPVVDAVLAEFESQRGAELVNVDYLRELARALTHLGLVDGSVRARLVRSLADDDARIRQASAAAVASLAWERPESLLAVGDDAVPTGYLKQVFGDDSEPVDEAPLVVRHLAAMVAEGDADSCEHALGALREFARTHPNAVYPLAGELASHLEAARPRVRLYGAGVREEVRFGRPLAVLPGGPAVPRRSHRRSRERARDRRARRAPRRGRPGRRRGRSCRHVRGPVPAPSARRPRGRARARRAGRDRPRGPRLDRGVRDRERTRAHRGRRTGRRGRLTGRGRASA